MSTESTIDKKPFQVDMKLVWTAAAALAYMVYTGTNRLNAIEGDIKSLKEAPAKVQQIDERQRVTDQAVKELQSAVAGMTTDMKSIKSDLQLMSAQVTQIASRLPR